ncbi:MAG TPA: GH3 auxin-responsive promoter family protein [Opitutaceae bacterium]|nr:GH3 auxin-responsive promoter family protein [Opitutaceae bacterium]
MPVWPKSFHVFGATVQAARTARRWRSKNSAAPEQERAFAELARRLGATTFWRAAGIEPAMDYETFRRRVAPRTYEQLSPAIEQMKRGAADVLWPGRCAFFASTAGTTEGRAKHLPVTEELLAHFQHAGTAALLYYVARTGSRGVYRGRHLALGGATALLPLPEAHPQRAFATTLNGVFAASQPAWEEKHLREPGAKIAEMTNWSAKLIALVEHTSRLDLSLVTGLPAWVLGFAEELCKKNSAGPRPVRQLVELWPQLEVFMHRGTPLAPFQPELRAVLGERVAFHEIYAAAEGCFAAQDTAAADLRLMADTNLFFEFLPMTDFDPTRLEQLGPRAVPLAGVKAGVDYALLLTSPGGLARYLVGDIVRFTSAEPPRLKYVGRTRLRLDAFGERVNEKDLTDALVAVCARYDWTIVNFHVAPIFAPSHTAQKRGRHEWWVELRPGTVATPTGPQMALALDAELQQANQDYRARRNGGGLEAPFVRLVMPGVFQHWQRYHGDLGHENKTPRCRSDRLVAEELAQITHFARD